MWSDNETTQDLLGYQVHADLLKKIILNDDMLPISIGVFGNWGSGKSSLMLLLQKSLHEWEKSQHEKGCKIILQVYFRFSTVWHNHLRNKHLTEHLRNNSNELATVRFSAFCGAMLSNNSFLMQR